MASGLETHAARAGERSTSSVRAPTVLRAGPLKLTVDPDGSVRHLESMAERRLLFGREQLHFYRLRGGTASPAQRPEWRLSSRPGEVSFMARPFEGLEVSQSLSIFRGRSAGFVRRVSVKNGGPQTRIRLIDLSDPTTAHFRDRTGGWGSIGVNAFNRSGHVVLDEAVEPKAARVIGSSPPPRLLYMCTDRGRASDVLQAGGLPEETAGMSGQVIVLAEQEMELPPGGSQDAIYVSVYNADKLEVALADFSAAFAPTTRSAESLPVACSSPSVSSAIGWAMAGLEGASYEPDLLDRLETLRGMAYLDADACRDVVQSLRSLVGRDGSLPHSLDPWRPGVLETSVFVEGACRFALLRGDKKYLRSVYPVLRRAANFLMSTSAGGEVSLDPAVPQGWRRRIGKGYPTGELPEVSLSVAGSLTTVAKAAARIGKAQDSARFRERAVVIANSVRKRLLDDRGYLALNLERGERLRMNDSIDQAVACYRHQFDRSVSASLIHRYLEGDFETGYGARTLPTSDRLFFNPSYGEGQIGGYWTRAALAQVVLAYLSGFGGTGSLELESVGRLVCSDVARYGGTPGDFPYWLDPERREVHGPGSDPVACSRYLEAVVAGELGVAWGREGLTFEPSMTSGMKWAAGDLLGGKVSVFVGRGGGRVFTFARGGEVGGNSASQFAGSERARTGDPAVYAVSFFNPGQVVCAGNSSESEATVDVRFKPRDGALSKSLTTGLGGLDLQSGSWSRVSTIKVLPSMGFELTLAPGEWKAFRLSS